MKTELIRKARRKNFRKIAQIYADGFSEPPYNEPWTLKDALKKIKIYSKYCNIWEIHYKNNLVGFVIVNPNHWFPGKFAFGEDISIKKEYRKKGIATRVLKKIMEIYQRKGFEYFVGISNKESKAFKLWNKLGIKENKYDKLISRKLK